MTIKGRLLSSTTTVKPKSAEYLIKKKKEKITNSEKPLSRVYSPVQYIFREGSPMGTPPKFQAPFSLEFRNCM